MRHGLGAGCALLIGLSALLASVAHASCSCSAPSPLDPAIEFAAKVIVAVAVIAFIGYRVYQQKDGGR